MNAALLEVIRLHKNFNGVKALEDFSVSIQKSEITGLIGPNGAGKTTFFNVLTRFIPSDHGKVILKGKNITNFTPLK